MRTSFLPVSLLCHLLLATGSLIAGDQLFNLAEVPMKSRTVITQDYWPSKPGEAAVCMWQNDKLAAMSITIDDNEAPNVDWWLETADKYQVPLTWFIITDDVGGPDKFVRGTWDLWARVLAKGHAIESHTMTHLRESLHPETWKGIDWEYGESQKQITAGIPGHQAHFLAYPGGPIAKANDPTVAAKYYLAARGTNGYPNGATTIDYLNVNAMSSARIGGTGGAWSDLNNLLDKNLFNGRQYGGWVVLLYHYVKPPYDTVLPKLEFYQANRAKFWFGLFGDVARYGQERDTSTLAIKESVADRIILSLTDRMDDRLYDFPLTVKIRLPDSWQGVSAQQAGKAVTSRIVMHEGARHALVDAVPDKGEIVLIPTAGK